MNFKGEIQEVQATNEANIIKGRLIELGRINKNGWGVKEVDLAQFKDIPVRACPHRIDKHYCDEMGDMNSIIGRTIEATVDAGWVWVTAKITDSIAQRKIAEGSWIPKWSVFGTGQMMEDGFVKDFRVEAISLVENPAYPEAGFEVAAEQRAEFDDLEMGVEEFGGAKWTRAFINSLPDSSFAYIEPCYRQGKTKDKNARHLPYKDKNGKIDLPHLRNALARVSQIEPICPDTNRQTAINEAMKVLQKAKKEVNMAEEEKVETKEVETVEADFKAEVEKLQAENEKLKEEVEKLQAEKAEMEKKLAGSISAEKFEEVKAELLEKAKASVLEEMERQELVEKAVTAGLKTGLFTEDTVKAEREKLQAKTLDELREQVKILTFTAEKIEESENKFQKTELPADTTVSVTVGRYDAIKREWVA